MNQIKNNALLNRLKIFIDDVNKDIDNIHILEILLTEYGNIRDIFIELGGEGVDKIPVIEFNMITDFYGDVIITDIGKAKVMSIRSNARKLLSVMDDSQTQRKKNIISFRDSIVISSGVLAIVITFIIAIIAGAFKLGMVYERVNLNKGTTNVAEYKEDYQNEMLIIEELNDSLTLQNIQLRDAIMYIHTKLYPSLDSLELRIADVLDRISAEVQADTPQ